MIEDPDNRGPDVETPFDEPFAPHEDDRAYPHPLILRYPGASAMWALTAAGRWVTVDEKTLRAELRTQWPELPLFKPGNFGPKPIEVSELVEKHARRVDSIVYDMTTDRHVYEPAAADLGGLLRISCAALDPEATPREDRACAAWLAQLAGEEHDRVLDWLATCHILTRPTAALYLHGPKGRGKGLLASACARLFGREVTSYAKISERFNGGLRNCPIVLLDEGLPTNDAKGSSFFRSLISESTHNIEEKHRPTATLRGCVRLIIAANNPDALRIREDLTREDEDAIGERIVMVRVPPTAPELNRSATARWIDTADGKPGALVRHVRWLQTTRKVKPGPRFLVHGDSATWIRHAARRGGLQQEILVAVARYVDREGAQVQPSDTPIWYGHKPAIVHVSADRLHRAWLALSPGSKVPTVTAIGRALRVVAGEPCEIELPAGGRVRVRPLPAEAVLDMASEVGIGDEDALRARLGMQPSDDGPSL